MVKIVYFDLDGVLWLPSKLLEKTLPRCIEKGMEKGLNVEDERVALKKLLEIRSVDSNAKDHFNELCKFFNGEDKKWIVKAMVSEYHKSKLSNMHTVPNLTNTLDIILKKGYTLALVSNGSFEKQRDKLDNLRLTHYFQHSDYSDGLIKVKTTFAAISDCNKKYEKPEPYLWNEIRRKVKKYTNKNIKGIEIQVGDRYLADIYGANKLGIVTVKVNQGKYKTETIDGILEDKEDQFPNEKIARILLTPDYEIDDMRRLIPLLETIEKGYSRLKSRKQYQKEISAIFK